MFSLILVDPVSVLVYRRLDVRHPGSGHRSGMIDLKNHWFFSEMPAFLNSSGSPPDDRHGRPIFQRGAAGCLTQILMIFAIAAMGFLNQHSGSAGMAAPAVVIAVLPPVILSSMRNRRRSLHMKNGSGAAISALVTVRGCFTGVQPPGMGMVLASWQGTVS